MNKNNISISYIMPAFNCASTIEESVASIYNNNFVDGDELIIVDDCSTDTTSIVLQELEKKYKGITVITHKLNKGGGASRNTAVENSKHDYVFCLDADNILETNSIANLKETVIRTGSSGAAFQKLNYFISNISEISHTWSFKFDTYDGHNYLSTVYVPGASGNYLYTKSSWLQAGGYPDYAGALDTWGFGLRQALTGSNICIYKNSGYYHRLSEKSYWKFSADKFNASVQATRILLEFYGFLSTKSLNHILSEKYRENWLDNLDKMPLALKEKSQNSLHRFLNLVKGIA